MTEIDMLNALVTDEIMEAERRTYEAQQAWKRVLETEARLVAVLPDGVEKDFASEGVVLATKRLKLLEEVDRGVTDETGPRGSRVPHE